MVHRDARRLVNRITLVMVVFGSSLLLLGCPAGYDVETGDWLLHFSPFPIHITFGLTLHPDGSATPYESVPGYGTLPGTWTWQTNGIRIWIYQNNQGNEYTYAGTLVSELAAYGEVFEGDNRTPIGTWEGARDN